MMIEQKIAKPWAPFNPFHTEFFYYVAIQPEVTNK